MEKNNGNLKELIKEDKEANGVEVNWKDWKMDR